MSVESNSLDFLFDDIVDQYYEHWTKKLDPVYAGRDFSRLGKKIRIFRESDSGERVVVHESREDDSTDTVIVSLLNSVGILLNSVSGKSHVRQEHLTSKDELHRMVDDLTRVEGLSKFLIYKYGSKSRTMKLFKCCDQGYIVFFLGGLMRALRESVIPGEGSGSRLFVKDVRGEWFIEITLHRDESFSLRHVREDQCMLLREKKYLKLFRFEWELVMRFKDGELKNFEEISAGLLNIDWGPESESERANGDTGLLAEKEKFENLFKKVFNDPKRVNLTVELSFNNRKKREREKKEKEKEKKKLKEKKKSQRKSVFRYLKNFKIESFGLISGEEETFLQEYLKKTPD